jgi:DNA-binding XRE family transcriptional regulator
MTEDSSVKKVRRIFAEFGDNLVVLRKRAGMTQSELADTIGLSRVMICNIEVGKNGASIETILKICAVLKCTPNDMFPKVPKVEIKNVITDRRIVVKKSLSAKFKW